MLVLCAYMHGRHTCCCVRCENKFRFEIMLHMGMVTPPPGPVPCGVRAWGTRCSLAQSGPNSAASFCRFCVAASRMEYT